MVLHWIYSRPECGREQHHGRIYHDQRRSSCPTSRHQAVENGIAISRTTAYIVTGPSDTDSSNATGQMFAFSASFPCPSNPSGIRALWNATYAAGSSPKPGGFARGSGTTPKLLGTKYLAITDNADSQIRLLIYHQAPQSDPSKQLLCAVPVFEPEAGAVDIGTIGHSTEYGYSALS